MRPPIQLCPLTVFIICGSDIISGICSMVSSIASSSSRQDIVSVITGWGWVIGLILQLLTSNEDVFICRTYFGFVDVDVYRVSTYFD